ncbi:DUF1439 domain-containing protein [Caenimonas sedimenti]|uniref:DUF1439 domain-containing protein n=1 Tax=Caenimonas sedimenti TaxID=2596921 RepID=A0A562ZE42_9BURK|nr:DUF1439 domain-containing protein [Caenimonas sedimenti]TWO64896.1 DUF1439 domain-containing protein [Caenimonas sedimenti]
MDRRLLITTLACWPVARLFAQDGEQRPRHKISAAELHGALAARFPVRFGLRGVLEVQASAPRLLMLPARNLLGATLVAQVSGRQAKEAPAGELDVVFALRYEPSDQTLRGQRLEILDLRWPGLPAESRQALVAVLPALAREALAEVVLHRFSPRELALAETMGFEPEQFIVRDDGLLILFGPRQRR